MNGVKRLHMVQVEDDDMRKLVALTRPSEIFLYDCYYKGDEEYFQVFVSYVS